MPGHYHYQFRLQNNEKKVKTKAFEMLNQYGFKDGISRVTLEDIHGAGLLQGIIKAIYVTQKNNEDQTFSLQNDDHDAYQPNKQQVVSFISNAQLSTRTSATAFSYQQ